MSKPLRLLQIEDSESDADMILRLLMQAGFEVFSQRVEDAEGLRHALEDPSWDVIVADYHLPGFDAPGALRILQECGQDIPCIVVSGKMGEDTAVEMMKSGAHDYLTKNNLTRLVPAVERELAEAAARRESKQAQDELRESEERLALAVDATQLGTFDFYPQTGKLIWSKFARQHFGVVTGGGSHLRHLPARSPSCRPRASNADDAECPAIREWRRLCATSIGPWALKMARNAGFPAGGACSSMRNRNRCAWWV